MSNVLLLKVLLTNEKFAIATASNGRQALEQVEKENPDLVLLDVIGSVSLLLCQSSMRFPEQALTGFWPEESFIPLAVLFMD